MSTQIHKITSETPPVFPCWLWNAEPGAIDKTPLGWERWPDNPLPYKYSPQRFTHWSKDAPTAPSEKPTLGGDDNAPTRTHVRSRKDETTTSGDEPPVIPSDPASRAAVFPESVRVYGDDLTTQSGLHASVTPNNEAPPSEAAANGVYEHLCFVGFAPDPSRKVEFRRIIDCAFAPQIHALKTRIDEKIDLLETANEQIAAFDAERRAHEQEVARLKTELENFREWFRRDYGREWENKPKLETGI